MATASAGPASLQTMKAQSQARENEERRLEERKRGTMVMILDHLLSNGYLDTVEVLQRESGVALEKFEAADNMDLSTIVQDFETYYEMRFRRKPKFFRKCDGTSIPGRDLASARAKRTTGVRSNSGGMSKSSAVPPIKREDSGGKIKSDGPADNSGSDLLGLTVAPAPRGGKPPRGARKGSESGADSPSDFFETRMLKPIPDFGWNTELRELASIITRDIFTQNPNVQWTDVAGLTAAKRILKEAVVMPVKYPELFTGILQPWKGLLLFGPPGTGKTLLAKAVATECKTTFFNISASTIVSKWRGDSEKLVRVLFELARYHAPSTIFLDEIDSLMGQRGVADGEHEGSRRMKTELLIQMDGLMKTDDLVFVLCASNLPWELDMALLRRLEKRILVQLPNAEAREHMFRCSLSPDRAPALDYRVLAERTEGYSGSDIHLVCKEAAMKPLRRLMVQLEGVDTDLHQKVVIGPCLMQDVLEALETTRPSAASAKLQEQYVRWQAEFGST